MGAAATSAPPPTGPIWSQLTLLRLGTGMLLVGVAAVVVCAVAAVLQRHQRAEGREPVARLVAVGAGLAGVSPVTAGLLVRMFANCAGSG